MKFTNFQYERPDMDVVEFKINELISEFEKAESLDDQFKIIRRINEIRMNYETMRNIASIKYTVNTYDKSAEDEREYFDTVNPVYSGLVNGYYKALLNSKFRNELKLRFGDHLFTIAEISLKTYSPEIVDDLREENQLSSRYVKLIASAKIFFRGEEKNLSGLEPFINSTDRETRKEASIAKWNFYDDNKEEFDEIYDKLVKVRDRISGKLGMKNFIELGYARMSRTDYNEKDAASFRDEVKKHIVPVAQKLKERQKKRLGLEELKFYDESLNFKTGNATPKGDAEWIVNNAKKMYGELSGKTGEFIDFMIDNELMDLYNKKGKAAGGYCTFLPNYKSPFIFANMNGTSDDIRVLTHEAGHAFQSYSSRNFEVPEYYFPTYEAAEIHSMSMEFFTWRWMNLFFNGDTEKFKFTHLTKSLLFLPYGVCVDEFQHLVYENPEATPAERKQMWKKVEMKYLPHRDYGGIEFLEDGGFWQQQGHIYRMPFYYIDYCLAEICAFQFWQKCEQNNFQCWDEYQNLCNAGGSKSFFELIKIANLKSPFDEGTVEEIVNDVNRWLENIEDSNL
jgi:M3 family oligoendopeptidase